MRGHHGHLSAEQKQLAFRLRSQGWRLIDIAREIGCSAPMVGLMVRGGRHRNGEPFGWQPRRGCLAIGEREQILLGISRHESLSAIARRLGRASSTITREVQANGGRERYSAWHAHHPGTRASPAPEALQTAPRTAPAGGCPSP
jgi:AraC-like DNA-binding protein